VLKGYNLDPDRSVYEYPLGALLLERHGYGIHIMWIPSHVGVMGNERADRLAGEAVQGDTDFAAPVRPLSRVRMLGSWQCS
jgi:hypothetical protein